MTITRVYLGRPGSAFGMQKLPAIPIGPPIGGEAGMSPTFSRAGVTSTLVSGGIAVARKRFTKSQYPIGWKIRGADDSDLLMSFFDGRQGPGPYCFVDPSQTNYLPPNVAGMGASLSGLPEWVPTVGALATSTQAGPAGLRSGVAAWTGAATASVLWMGLNNVIDGTWLPPVLSGLAHRFAIWAKVSAGSATLAAAVPYGVGGSAPIGNATATAAGVALSSSWQEISALVASSFSWTTGQFAGMKLTVSSATTPTILLAAPSMQYDSSIALAPWVSGVGVPRVVIDGDAGSPVGRPGLRDWTMTLRES